MQKDNISCTSVGGYHSSYDYTIYDISFVFDIDEEEEFEASEDNLFEEDFSYINPTDNGGNFH